MSDNTIPASHVYDTHGNGALFLSHTGMSLRDYFASKAMQGFIPIWANTKENIDELSATAYKLADAMLAARGE